MDTINVKVHYLIKRPFKQRRLSVFPRATFDSNQISVFIFIVEKRVISSNTLFNEAF